jgi:hypothetical protein
MKRLLLVLAFLLLAVPAQAQIGQISLPPVGEIFASCTNQVVTALAASGTTCTTITSAYVNSTIAQTGTDINTSQQVTATHLAAGLPVGQGGTGLQTLTAHALYVGAAASSPTALAVCGTGTYVRGATGADPGCSTLTLPNTLVQGDIMAATAASVGGVITAAATGQYLMSQGTSTLPAYKTNAFTHSNPTNKTGNGTSTLKMNGLACAITPTNTGRVVLMITGNQVNGTIADGVKTALAYGTGSAPNNTDAAQGTIISATQVMTQQVANEATSLSIIASVTGLVVSTAIWFDLQVADVTGGTATITNVDCTAFEQ